METTHQILAPEGFQELSKGTRYHCLRNDAAQGRVFLVSFFNARPGATLHVLKSSDYESALASRALVPAQPVIYMPPWLSELAGVDLELIDGQRKKAVISHKDVVEQRCAHLQPAIQNLNEILSAANPESEINRYARQAQPRQHETRYRVWLFVYLCFGHNSWALMPPVHRNGIWLRAEKPETKFGRQSLKGGAYGCRCTPQVVERIVACYHKYACLGRSMIDVYMMSMELAFKCKSVENEDGSYRYVQRTGDPFPSESQFRYWCRKHIGGDDIQRTLYGEQRFRNRLQPDGGRYSQEVANLMEKIEGDAYSTREHPRGYVGGHVSPKVFVVRLCCMTGGTPVGIGFSHGSETAEAYLAALFCAAIGKSRFCRLFGIDIEDDAWPCQGLPAMFIPDRGPGASDDVVKRLRDVVSIIELPPSNTPQSHGTVESHHPREVQVQGSPTYETIDLDPVGMARREIFTLLAQVLSSDASHRMTVEMRRDNVMPTTLGIWKYLSGRGRNDAQFISFEDAVRKFLTPVQFNLVEGRLFLKKLAYNSAELRSELADSGYRKTSPSTSLKGYALSMCVRHTWVTIGAKLIEVDAQLPIRDDERQLYISLLELEDYEQLARLDRRRLDQNRTAARSAIAAEATETLGIDPRSSRRNTGRANAKTEVALREVVHMKRRSSGAR